MATTSCTTSATGTTTSLVTTSSVTTIFTASTTTDPATTTTITTTECALGIGSLSSLPCISTTSTITSTIPGAVETISVPVEQTVPVTETSTITLFGSSCTVIQSSSTPAPPVSPSSSVFTPPPVTITSQSSSTMPNGQVTVIPETITSTQPASIVYVSQSASVGNQQSDQQPQNNTDGSASAHVAPIVGGVVAGFFGLLGIALLVWFIMKRRRRWDDIFDHDYPSQDKPRPPKRFSVDAAIEPKPYHYGLVGKTPSPTAGMSPPNSPPRPPHIQLPPHGLTPLALPMTASSPGLSAGATSVSSRPSTAGSMRPLRDTPASPPTASGSRSPPPPTQHAHTTSSGSGASVHVAPAMPAHWGHHSPSPSADTVHFERDLASPTAASVREYDGFGRLQLANLSEGETVEQTPPTPSPLAAASAGPSSRTSAGPALLDGKGRNVRLGSGGPGVLVHKDGGPAPSYLLS